MASLYDRIAQANPGVTANRAFIDALFQQGYNRTATDREFSSVLERSGTGRVSDVANIVLGKNSPFFKPTVTNRAERPINAQGLGDQLGGNEALSQLLGFNTSQYNVPDSIAGLLSLFGKTSQEEQRVTDLQSEFINLQKQTGQQGQDLQTELEAQGVPQAFEQVKQLNLKGAQLQGDLESFDAQTEQYMANIDSQPIPTGLIQGQKGQLQKQRDITRMGKAAELSSTIALAQAYQGNAVLGQQLAQQAVEIKYQPLFAQLDVLKNQIGFAQETLGRADQKRSTILTTLLDLEFQNIEEQKKKESGLQELAIQAATAGAPLSVIEAMRTSGDLVQAASIGAKFISGLSGSLENLAAEAAAQGASQDVVNQMRNAGSLSDASRIGAKYLSGTSSSIDQLAVEAAINGAPQSVIDQMRGAGNTADAAKIGSSYLKGSIRGTGAGAASTPGVLDFETEKSIRQDVAELQLQVRSGEMTTQDAYNTLRTLYSTKEASDSALQQIFNMNQTLQSEIAISPEGDYPLFSKGTSDPNAPGLGKTTNWWSRLTKGKETSRGADRGKIVGGWAGNITSAISNWLFK